MADAGDLKSSGLCGPCGFEPRLRYVRTAWPRAAVAGIEGISPLDGYADGYADNSGDDSPDSDWRRTTTTV